MQRATFQSSFNAPAASALYLRPRPRHLAHPFFTKAYRNALILPNRIQVNTPEDADTAYSGRATDNTSYALIPKTRYEECAVISDAQAASMAEAILSKYRLHAQEG